jgi:hypothetical protein
MRSRLIHLAYFAAIASAMLGWIWFLLRGIVWFLNV